jgi:hypothetical protein
MIIIIENGGLGNQLFQYFFCKSIASKNEKIYLLGFDDLKKLINDEQLCFLIKRDNILYKIIFRFKWKLDKFLFKYKIFNFVFEESQLKKNNIFKSKGIFSLITYVSGFFQNETFIKKKILKDLKINNYLINQARKSISLIKQKENSKIIFIHLRGRDYKFWPSKRFSAVIPFKWYIKCINKFKLIYKKEKIIFIFFSDDKKYFFKKNFFNKNYIFIEKNLLNNFLMMSLCDGGVLSASTYSWWPAFFSFSKNKNKVFFAPKYWAGHRLKQYFPLNFNYTSFLKYIDVNKSDYK